MNKELYSIIQSNEYVMEAFNDMRVAQPAKDRMHYFDTVLEGSSEANAILLQKLYNDVVSKSNIDFGTIPDSRGNILKYKGYPLIEQSMDKINRLFEGIPNDEVKLMNSLHDMIISCKKDFEFGFLNNIDMIILLYNTSVMSLHEMISLCVFEYTQMMRKNAGVDFNFANTKKKNLIIIKNTRSLIKAYEDGQFQKVMKAFRKDPHMLEVSEASEGLTEGIKQGMSVVSKIGTIASNVPKFISIPLAVVAGIILLLQIIRGAIYLFYSGAVSIRDYAKTEKEIVDIYIENEKTEGADKTTIEKHSKISSKLQSIANFIEVKILNNDKQAKQNLEKSNREDFNRSDFSNSPFGNIEI